MNTTGKTTQSTNYQLVSYINTSLDNLFLINVVEHYNKKANKFNVMYTYDMFELQEQTN